MTKAGVRHPSETDASLFAGGYNRPVSRPGINSRITSADNMSRSVITAFKVDQE
jgi:hypothetical protein